MLAMFLLLSAAAPDGWTEAAKDGALTIYNREKPGSDVKQVLARGSFDASPELIHRVLDDLNRYHEFLPYNVESRVLKTEGTTMFSYERINAPLVAQRDYTVRISHEPELEKPDRIVIRHSFRQSNKDGPPPKEGIVRVEILEGYWELEPLDNGKRTKATYYIYMSPGGSVPSFAINMANNSAVPALFAAVAKAAKDPRYLKPAP